MNPFAIFKVVMGAISLGKLFWNGGKLIRFFKTVGPIVSNIVTEHRKPTSCEMKEFLHATAVIIRSGVVDIPGVDEADVAAAIESIDEEITCSIKAA